MAQSVIGALRVSLGLDSAKFETGARRAGSTAQKLAGNLQKVGAAISVVGAGIVAVVRGQLSAAEQIGRQAQIANAGVVEFQRFAIAAREVGIEQDKLSDILKDVNDKVGDFLTTGGGPLKDFFEQIAPQVGVTAEQFRNLSGPQALQLYVDSLEKANLSQAEMTFFLEAIANDATALIPLLRDNGAEMNRLADAGARAGAIISEETVAAAMQFQESLRQIGLVLSGVVRQIAADLAPIMADLADTIADLAERFGRLSPEMRKFAAALAAITVVAGPLAIAIGTVTKAILAMRVAALAFTGPFGLAVALLGTAAAAFLLLRDNAEQVETPVDTAREAIDGLNAAMGVFSSSASPTMRAEALSNAQSLREQASAAIQAAEAQLALMEAEYAAQRAAPMEGAEGGLLRDMVEDNMADDIAFAKSEIEGLRASLDLARSRMRQAAGEITSDMGGAMLVAGEATQKVNLELQGLDETLDKLSGAGGTGGGGGGGVPGLVDALDDVPPVMVQIDQRVKTMQDSFGAAFADIVTGATSARDAVSQLLNQLANSLLQSAGSQIFGAIAGAFRIPGFATGTPYAAGGLAMVGERGPELVQLPRGSRVFNNAESMGMMGGASSKVEINIDARGAQVGVAEQVRRELARELPNIERLAVASVQGARRRGFNV